MMTGDKTSEYHTILTSVRDGVAELRFNRPEHMNALNSELFGEAIDCLSGWSRDPSVAVIVLTGGNTAFAAGLDLDELVHHNADDQDLYNETTYAFYKMIFEYPKPTIASIAGPAIGGGADIVGFCDIRIGATSSIYSWPQVKFGMTTFIDPLSSIVGLGQAKRLLFTGETIDAAEASRIGLLELLVADDALDARTQKLARAIARNGIKTLRVFKEQALRSPAMDPLAGFVYAHALYRDVSRDAQVQANIRDMADRLKAKTS
ncbi:enoyl-CoA hydratase/isomerase family protein [Mycolicibacterium sphagni]|uniref:Enoyl-CoA hydratase n=1 Tax=Mycolicibacterium sphagni TaxID=1786 RepID=A0A255DC35_9MYCO|nr:enoyl-CoA hydratase/isomerase family protein [Mycolicibacterium sphagni]OYN76181.1 hypothetical protein CG716_22800 [Mycolicibacterium sphagni]